MGGFSIPSKATGAGCSATPLLLALASAAVVRCVATGAALRGVKTGIAPPGTGIAGFGAPIWGGRYFEESPLARNIWVTADRTPLINDLNPIAPFDRMDQLWTFSPTGAAPLEPGVGMTTGSGFKFHSRPDWVPPLSHPDPFPAEGEPPLESRVMDEGNIVAVADRLRSGDPTKYFDTAANYPLTAPADVIPGGEHPVAEKDKVPHWVGRYLDASYDRSVNLEIFHFVDALFHEVDSNSDSAISVEEYKTEVEGRQNKSAEDALALWNQYHQDQTAEDMTELEFKRLAASGFDAKVKGRANDIFAVLRPPGTAPIGFWGSGAMCPNGTYVEAVSLKMAGTTPTAGINAAKLRCSDKSELSTIEGPNGEWTAWSECPAGQVIYGFRAKKQPFDVAREANAALKDFAFECRSPSMTSMTRLSAVGGAPGGGWTADVSCDSSSAICGSQARLQADGDVSNQGLSDLRLFCCRKDIDCSSVCQETVNLNTAAYAACMVCQNAQHNANTNR